MSKFWILIGTMLLVFAFSGKAQSEVIPYLYINDSVSLKFHGPGRLNYNAPNCPYKWTEVEDEIALLKGENDLKMVHKICENYCLQYRRYKQYRKCMLIFNK